MGEIQSGADNYYPSERNRHNSAPIICWSSVALCNKDRMPATNAIQNFLVAKLR